ncbi:glucosaminidase domain-containing protein [Planktomarina temperata]|nr:glucosaminidase domain-containing protein [Planktomarina temperata]
MEYEANGLMAANAPLIKRTPVLTECLNSLAPQQAQTLEQQLAGMTESDRAFLMTMAKMVQLSMQMRIGSGDQSQGYYDLVTQMYGKVSPTKRRLVAEILDASSPLDFEPTPKKSQADAAMSFYEEPEMQVSPRSEPSQADDETASALEAVLAEVFPEPQRKPASQPSKVAVGKEAFLAAYTPVAEEVAKDLGVSHRIVLAQAALESGWGKSVKGNGLMGIKSHGEDGGLDVITHEVVNGKRVKITDSFRQYDSPEDSIRGYGSFLKANSRYKHFLRAGTENEDAQLSALQSSGYASDPKYAFKLRNIMNGLPDEQGET